MSSRLSRSRTNSMLGGVCAGLANFIQVDVTIVRLVFVLLTLVSGAGFWVYVVLWFLLPLEDAAETKSDFSAHGMENRARQFGAEVSDVFTRRRSNTLQLAGIGLVCIGIFALLRILIPGWMVWFDRFSLPAFLITIGGLFLVYAIKGGKQ